MAREVNSRLLRTLSMLRYCSAGTNLAELVRIGKEMGYEGEELQRFVDKQQEREERLLEREERLLEREREREERLLAQEERREERQRPDEMQIRRPEVQRKAQKRLEGDRKGECCFSRSESLLTKVLLRVTP